MSSDNYRVSLSVSEVLFGPDRAGRPVYTLADSKALKKICELSGLSGVDPLAELVAIVRGNLNINSRDRSAFHWYARCAEAQRNVPLKVPEVLPLLVVLTTAAERMQVDAEMASHNYYSRLHQLLQVPDKHRQKVEDSYRSNALIIWSSLNRWLEAWDGERGIPTAYSIGRHEYVGLPMSQAVVRQYDRDGLHEFFAAEGFSPGARVSPYDMETALEPYVQRTGGPLSAHLVRLWKSSAARQSVIDASCLELSTWDGSSYSGIRDSLAHANSQLLIFLKTFPQVSVEFNLMLPYVVSENEQIIFDVADGEFKVPAVAGPGGTARLAASRTIEEKSIIGDKIVGRIAADQKRRFKRNPKRISIMRWDPLQGAYVESERASFGEDLIIVAAESVRLKVESHLNEHARPGWRELPSSAGIPTGWTIYDRVQIISAPSVRPHADILPLFPGARTSLSLRGGFVLPGLLRKWSSLEPPEIVAQASGASSITVQIYDGSRKNQDDLLLEITGQGELAVVPLNDKELDDGEYLISMSADSASKAASTALLRLRSAASPEHETSVSGVVRAYSPEYGARWPLTSSKVNLDRYVTGARIIGLSVSSQLNTAHMPEFVPRSRHSSRARVVRKSVGVAVKEDSCLYTGMHHFVLPPARPGQAKSSTVYGECSSCGLVKRFAGNAYAARSRKPERRLKESELIVPPIAEPLTSGLIVADDAVHHVGEGTFRVFERIAAQVEGSGLFADSYLRSQEIVGHIDVERDEWFQVTNWSSNSPTLVPIAQGRWVLIGRKSKTSLAELERTLGGQAKLVRSVDGELPKIEVQGQLSGLALEAQMNIQVLDKSPAQKLISSLPSLSEMETELNRIVVPEYNFAEMWNTTTASWQYCADLAHVGAYRLNSYRSIYVLRSKSDIDDGLVKVGNAQLVKHIANRWAGDLLCGYHSASGSVVVPLGADLPGLFGRALSLCSGSAPRKLTKHRMLQYPAVNREVADVLFAKISR